jgi:hypothetical protein
MPFDIPLEPNEEMLLNEFYLPSKKSEPFAFGVSNRALFLPRKKTFAVKDPWYFQRVPLSEVQAVALRRIRPAGIWILSIVMVLSGALTTYWMLDPSNRAPGSRVSGYPIAVFVVGLILPFAARGRYTLVVALTSGTFKWRPRVTVGVTSKAQAVAIQERILEACRRIGVLVRDERRVA